jgi:hypothetical protein
MAIGCQTLVNSVSGQRNVAIGTTSLYNTNSSYNIAIGYQAGYDLKGGNTIAIGNNALIGWDGASGYPFLTNTNYNVVIGDCKYCWM